jgi:hypothetical protein
MGKTGMNEDSYQISLRSGKKLLSQDQSQFHNTNSFEDIRSSINNMSIYDQAKQVYGTVKTSNTYSGIAIHSVSKSHGSSIKLKEPTTNSVVKMK